MKLNLKKLSVFSMSIVLLGCNGGGGGSSSEPAAQVQTPLTYRVEQVSQLGFSNTFLPNGKTVLDLRPFGIWSYYYVYFTNNQTFPLVHGVEVTSADPTNGSNTPSITNHVAQPNDPLDCANTQPLVIGAQCRALMRSLNGSSSMYHQNQSESFNTLVNYTYCWADKQMVDGYQCNSSGGGGSYGFPQIKIPSIAGLWTVASNGSPISGKLFSFTLDGSAIFTSYPSEYTKYAKYPITYNQQNGTAWINFESPTQIYNYVGSNQNKMFTYTLQPIGQSDGALWAQNAGGMSFDQAVYSYGTNSYYSIPTWLELSDVGIANYGMFTNGLDGGLYLYGGNNVDYKFNGVSFVRLNIATTGGIRAVASDGTIMQPEGCYKTTDGINYTLTPFSSSESITGFGNWNNKIWAGGREVDTDKCVINPYPKVQGVGNLLPETGEFNDPTPGHFGANSDGNMYFYPPDSYWK